MSRVAVFDLDGTLICGNSSFSFCRFLHQTGVLSRLDLLYCTFLYLRHILFGLSLWQLHSSAFKRLFQGKTVESLLHYVPPFIETLKWYAPALSRLNQLRNSGIAIHIFSNSPTFLVKAISESIGIENVKATDYKIDNTGRLWDIATFVDGEKKSQLLQEIGEETIAFSDSHHDLPFLMKASSAVAVNPTRRLHKIARLQNWEIL